MGCLSWIFIPTILVACLAIGLQVFISQQEGVWSIPQGLVEGKNIIVTGANTGLGFETAKELVMAGAHVVLACRNMKKCDNAVTKIGKAQGTATAMKLDLIDPRSVAEFVEAYKAEHDELHLLFNNAAIMATPFMQTPHGVEAQFAVNHLGHFLLTKLLLDLLKTTDGARVINHSSSASDMCSQLDVTEISRVSEADYSPWSSYGCSKRANRYFTWGLNRKWLKDTGVIATMCHPGYAATDLQHRATGHGAVFAALLGSVGNNFFAQSVGLGAQPQLMAAVEPSLTGDELTGPKYFMFGAPQVETREGFDLGNGLKCEEEQIEKLWQLSEKWVQEVTPS